MCCSCKENQLRAAPFIWRSFLLFAKTYRERYDSWTEIVAITNRQKPFNQLLGFAEILLPNLSNEVLLGIPMQKLGGTATKTFFDRPSSYAYYLCTYSDDFLYQI